VVGQKTMNARIGILAVSLTFLSALPSSGCSSDGGDAGGGDPVHGTIGATDAKLETAFYGVRRRLDGRVEPTATIVLVPSGGACDDGRLGKTPSGVKALAFPVDGGDAAITGLVWNDPNGTPTKVFSGRVVIVQRPSFTRDAVSGELVGDLSVEIKEGGVPAGSLAGRFRAAHCAAMDDQEIVAPPNP